MTLAKDPLLSLNDIPSRYTYYFMPGIILSVTLVIERILSGYSLGFRNLTGETENCRLPTTIRLDIPGKDRSTEIYEGQILITVENQQKSINIIKNSISSNDVIKTDLIIKATGYDPYLVYSIPKEWQTKSGHITINLTVSFMPDEVKNSILSEEFQNYQPTSKQERSIVQKLTLLAKERKNRQIK